MSETVLLRESPEYFEIVSEIFADLLGKATEVCEANGGEVTPSLVQCLQYVYLHGPSPIRKIASGLSISFPAASQLVDRLVQKDLVSRQHNMDDRRLARVGLTEQGRAVVTEARSARLRRLQEILDRMPPARRETLVQSLEEFIQAALQLTGRIEDACVRCGIDHLAFCVVSKVRAAATGKPMEEF